MIYINKEGQFVPNWIMTIDWMIISKMKGDEYDPYYCRIENISLHENEDWYKELQFLVIEELKEEYSHLDKSYFPEFFF